VVVNPEPNWRATAQALNALPFAIRRYIQKLEDTRDPEGEVRERMILEQHNEQLREKLLMVETELKAIKEGLKDDSRNRG
jgi:hypothetical protein